MNIFPDQYSNIELSKPEKMFVTYAKAKFDGYGYLLIRINPALMPKADLHALITDDGLLLFKFFESVNDIYTFGATIPAYHEMIYQETINAILGRLISNKAICDDSNTLMFPVNMLCVFPYLRRDEIKLPNMSFDFQDFIQKHCVFACDLDAMKAAFSKVVCSMMENANNRVSSRRLAIDDSNINSIIQRIAPEYVILRVGEITNIQTKAGADEELLVVTEDDRAAKAYMLDKEQINIINQIKKGEQLILACAGSGKSVLLVAKCFKAASLNPDKKFLLTCYNRNLQSMYEWLIDKAGFRARNVECVTFLTLCKHLLERNGCFVPQVFNGQVEVYFDGALRAMSEHKISDRYYGIFIDEVQIFDTDWYKFCFNLLENKNSDEHLFIICGDKTQDIKKRQRQGKAPWNAGDGYPNYRGGNKSLRIEKNYRNSIEINEYMNRFVMAAKNFLHKIDKYTEIDPDIFLRGQSIRSGPDVVVDNIQSRKNVGEAQAVIKAVDTIHKNHHIPYDEIAVVIYNKKNIGALSGWDDYPYNIIDPLCRGFEKKQIPYVKMYSLKDGFAARYGMESGVVFTSFDGVLGLDFRAVVVCGIKPLGVKDGTNRLDWIFEQGIPIADEKVADFRKNISFLYIACTRAKEILHIVTAENADRNIYVKLLNEAQKQ